MCDYVKQLEQQNEQLQKKLAEAQTLIEWRNSYWARRLTYHYQIECVFDDDMNQVDIPDTLSWFLPRMTVSHILTHIRINPNNLFNFNGFMHFRKLPVRFYSIHMIATRNGNMPTMIGEKRTIFGSIVKKYW